MRADGRAEVAVAEGMGENVGARAFDDARPVRGGGESAAWSPTHDVSTRRHAFAGLNPRGIALAEALSITVIVSGGWPRLRDV